MAYVHDIKASTNGKKYSKILEIYEEEVQVCNRIIREKSFSTLKKEREETFLLFAT